MKKILYSLLIVSLFACTGDDKPESHVFLKQIIGEYRLTAAYTDVAIDINFDGVPQTNIIEEAECYIYFRLDFTGHNSGSITTISHYG